jgi:nucleoside-diphosphate-sugar epimerase
MRVLVTGHEGYLGSVMVPELIARGHHVVGFDTGYFAECTIGPQPVAPTRVVDGDLRDAPADLCSGIDAVVHLAALSNDPLGNLDPALTSAINVEASLRLARRARDAGVARFVFSSSCSLYGAGGNDLVDEDAPLRPVTPYAESKVRFEDGLHALADADFSPISLRNATAYGWSPRLRLDIVLNDLVAHALCSGEVRVLSDGTPWRPIVHAADIATVFAEVLDAPRAAVHDAVFNVGFPDQNYQVREIADTVASVVDGSRVVITGETGPDLRSYRVDFSRLARTFPAVAPAWDARRGAEDLAARLGASGFRADDRLRLTRLAWIASLQRAGRLTPSLRWVDGQPSAPISVS